PEARIDAVQDSGQHIGASAQQSVEAPAKGGGLDLARVGRAYCGEAIRVEETSLDKRHHAEELDPIDREEFGRQCQLREDPRGKRPSVGEVVDSEDRGYVSLRRWAGEVSGSEPGMPVMSVQDVGAPARIGATRQLRRDPAEQSKAAVIVGPIATVRARIGVAGPIVEGGMVDEIGEALGAGEPSESHPHPLSGKRRWQSGYIGDAWECVEKTAEAGQQQAYINALCDQRRRQRRGDIAEAARLDPGIELGRDVEDAHRGQREKREWICLPASGKRCCPSPSCSASSSSVQRPTRSSPR